MTKSACHPLRSSFSYPKEEVLPTSNPLPTQIQKLADSSGFHMPAVTDPSPSAFRSYSYRFSNCDPGTLTAPLSNLPWPHIGLPLDYQGHSIPSLNTEEHDATATTFLPALPYLELQSVDDSSNHWYGLNNIPYPADYPQSDFFHVPPQQSEVSSSQVYGFPGQRTLSNPDFTASQRNRGGLPTIDEPYPPTPTISPPHEIDSPYQRREGDHRHIDEDETDDNNIDSEPYAQLIGRALKSAPEHKMVLKDIYRWFEKNTNKARSGSKGWQNSIRHNLSMNGGFRKVDQEPPTDDAKRGFIWVLEPSALLDGVKSTTRYRKSGSNKKVVKARHPAPERQRSGARGGKASRNFAKIRRSARLEGPMSWDHRDIPVQSIERPTPGVIERSLTPPSVWTPDSTGSLLGMPSRSLTAETMEQQTYSYEDIAGVTDTIPSGPLFLEDDHDMSGNGVLDYPSFVSNEAMVASLGRRYQRI
ncbi:MAG: hypothetical protein Q9218_002451 [Villophora microphyllina]